MKDEIQIFCEEHNLTTDQFYGMEDIRGNLYLPNATSIVHGFCPKVIGTIYLPLVKVIPQTFNPITYNLFLNSVVSVPNNFHPIVGGSLDLRSVVNISSGFKIKVGRSLYLNSLEVIPNNVCMEIGSSLEIPSILEIADDFNPIVGGNIISNEIVCNSIKPEGRMRIDFGSTFYTTYFSLDGRFIKNVITHDGYYYLDLLLNKRIGKL